MKKFLSRILKLKLGKFEYETSRRVYIFHCIAIKSDLLLIELHLDIVYWITTQSIADRNAEMEKYLENLYLDFDLTDLAEVPEPVKKIPTKKPSVKTKKAAKKK